jgi:hypothetical protein
MKLANMHEIIQPQFRLLKLTVLGYSTIHVHFTHNVHTQPGKDGVCNFCGVG